MVDQDTKQRTPLTDGEVQQAFRALSEEHLTVRRKDDPEASWRLIEKRLESSHLHVVPPASRDVSRRWSWVSGSFGGRALAVAGAFVVVLVVFGVSRWGASESSPGALTYVVEGARNGSSRAGDPTEIEAEGQLVATDEQPAALVFSDQSRVELAPYTTLRVHVEPSGRVAVRLARGQLSVQVVHQDDTDYRFRAGAYEVRVVGTAFRLGYEPTSGRFDVAMTEGRVIVAEAGGRERALGAGQTLHLPDTAQTSDLAGDSVGPTDASGVKMETDAAPVEGGAAQEAAGTQADPPAAGALGPTTARGAQESYRSLAAAGRFQQIVNSAKSAGVDHVLRTKAPSELQELAQAARYTGDLTLAERTWKELQARHGAQDAGRNASFFLGRLAEQRGKQGEALRQYDAYLAAAPRGVFAAEALGRKMLIVQATSGKAKARPLAIEYLKRFPGGAYVGAARALAND